jgi:ABC-type glycerol-3-phosphate transport system permease component
MIFLTLVLVAIAVAVILTPYIWLLCMSFKSTKEISWNPAKILPIDWTLYGYKFVLDHTPFFSWLKNSAIVTGTVTVGVLITSSLAGFVFAKYRFKGKEILFWLLLATMMVPMQTSLIPFFLIINELHLYNTLGALIVPMLVSAFGIFLCRQFCEDIPDSLCEAAHIDGAHDFYIYTRIIVPLLRPCLAALAIFTFLGTWNEYLMPLIMIEETSRMTLPVALSYFTGFRAQNTSAVMAAAAMITFPVTVFFLLLQKQFIKGITLTGVKS